MIIENNHLIAEEGKVLTNGEVYTTELYLGIRDTPQNWQEINIEEIPPEPEEIEDTEDYKTALQILLDL